MVAGVLAWLLNFDVAHSLFYSTHTRPEFFLALLLLSNPANDSRFADVVLLVAGQDETQPFPFYLHMPRLFSCSTAAINSANDSRFADVVRLVVGEGET